MRKLKYVPAIVPCSLIAVAWSYSGKLTDAQIAAIVVRANQVDIDAGVLARRKGHANEVKEFAKQMVSDHTGVYKSAIELVQRLHMTPKESLTSSSLRQDGDENVATLSPRHGMFFDKAYRPRGDLSSERSGNNR